MTMQTTRQMRKGKAQKEKEPAPGTQTIAYKQSILDGLVISYGLVEGNIFPWHMDDIDACRDGLKRDLKALIDECKGRELDFKIKAIKREIDIIKSTKIQ